MGFISYHDGLALPYPAQREKLHGIMLGGQDPALGARIFETDAGPADIKRMRTVIAIGKEHDALAFFRHAKTGHRHVQ